MAKEISINFTEDELEVLNSILVNLQYFQELELMIKVNHLKKLK